jgi:hypothetical protein
MPTEILASILPVDPITETVLEAELATYAVFVLLSTATASGPFCTPTPAVGTEGRLTWCATSAFIVLQFPTEFCIADDCAATKWYGIVTEDPTVTVSINKKK